MPTPSREQFEAATKKVMQTAPAGLSRDDFFKLVDQELSTFSSGTPLQSITRGGGESEPMPGEEKKPGLIQGLVSMGQGMAHPGVDTTTGKAKSKLGTAGDMASLAVPSFLGAEGRTLLDAGKRYWQGTKAAAAETTSARDALTLPVRAYSKVKDALPSSNRAAADTFLNRGAKYEPKPPVITGGDVTPLPKAKPAAVPLPPQAKAPTLEEALMDALKGAGEGDAPSVSTLAPDAAPVMTGTQKPKLPAVKGSKAGRPGGYTTENPPKGAYGPAEQSASTPVEEAGAELAPEGVTRSPADTRAGMEKPRFNAQEVSRMQELTGQMLPNGEMADTAATLRRLKGSRDAGAAMFPEMPSSARGELVKKLAPGPSRVPLEAEERIAEAARKAKGDMDLPSMLMAMLAGGGGALASRQTTPNFSGLPE